MPHTNESDPAIDAGTGRTIQATSLEPLICCCMEIGIEGVGGVRATARRSTTSFFTFSYLRGLSGSSESNRAAARP